MTRSRISGFRFRRLFFAVCTGTFLLLCGCRTLITVGAVETVFFTEWESSAEARVDTGAALCSLGVSSVAETADRKSVFFVYGGQRYCLPLLRTVTVHTAEGVSRRPTVELTTAIRNRIKRCEWTLSDRSKMRYPVLIGRNWLSETAVVDVSDGMK